MPTVNFGVNFFCISLHLKICAKETPSATTTVDIEIILLFPSSIHFFLWQQNDFSSRFSSAFFSMSFKCLFNPLCNELWPQLNGYRLFAANTVFVTSTRAFDMRSHASEIEWSEMTQLENSIRLFRLVLGMPQTDQRFVVQFSLMIYKRKKCLTSTRIECTFSHHCVSRIIWI